MLKLIDALDLSKAKFGVMLKGLLHGYKPAKNTSFATGGYNMIVVGASIDGTEAYVKSILKSPECPENVLCMGADYVFSDKYEIDLHGYIVFLPELIYLSDRGISQILHTLTKIKRALTPNADAQYLFGPDTAAFIIPHMYKRWLNNDSIFYEFDYNSPPEGLVFDAKKFAEYGALYRKGQNNLHQESYPILFPVIKAKSVIFDIDLEQFADEHIAHMLMRCQSVNPNLKRWVHKRIAARLFELADADKCADFVCREHDDRDHQDRDVLEWPLPVEDEDPAQENEPNRVPECKQEPAPGVDTLTVLEGKGVPHPLFPYQEHLKSEAEPNGDRTVTRLDYVGNVSLEDIAQQEHKGDRNVLHVKLPGDATVEDVNQLAKMFHNAGVDACTPGPLPDCDEDLRPDTPKD